MKRVKLIRMNLCKSTCEKQLGILRQRCTVSNVQILFLRFCFQNPRRTAQFCIVSAEVKLVVSFAENKCFVSYICWAIKKNTQINRFSSFVTMRRNETYSLSHAIVAIVRTLLCVPPPLWKLNHKAVPISKNAFPVA